MRPDSPSATRPGTLPPLLLQPWLDALLEGCCIIDATTQQIVGVNTAACELWGRSAAALQASTMADLAATPEDHLFWLDAPDPARLPPGAPALHSDTLILHADGTVREVERRITPMPLGDGRAGWLMCLSSLAPQRRAEAELHRISLELGTTLENTHDAILATDLDGAVRSYNRAFAVLWQLDESRPAEALPDMLAAAMAHPAAYRQQLCARQAEFGADVTPGPQATRFVTDRFLLKDGRTLERRLVPQYGRGGAVGWLQIWRDLTQQLADEARLLIASRVFEASQDALIVTDERQCIVAANPAACRLIHPDDGLRTTLTGLRMDAVLGDAYAGPVPQLPLRRQSDASWQGALTVQAVNSPPVPVQATVIDLAASGCGPGQLFVLRDLRERLAQQQQLHDLRLRDGLTGLANRAQLMQWMDHHAAHAPGEVPPLAVLMLGIDRLRNINDSLGHPGGDQVIIEVARRLSSGVRTADALARLGSDTFVVLLHGADAPTAEATTRRLLTLLGQSMTVSGARIDLSLSAGIALYPADGKDLDTLLENASRAMLRVHQHHHGDLRYCVYQPRMSEEMRSRLQLDQAMRKALTQGGFHLRYQPQIDMDSGRLVGAEALCRWHDPELGEVSPMRFIAAAEASGLIVELGHWVLSEAVRQAAAWYQQGHAIAVSVNVSILQFQQGDFIERVAEQLRRHRLPAHLLELELTESILIGDLEDILLQLQDLASRGVRLAIDDFGTGYSSLNYVKRLPIHRIKIDRSFIQRLPDDRSDAAITQTIIDLARSLRLAVIAEGVETPAQFQALADMGCGEYQGYLCAPALPVAQFEAWLKAQPAPLEAAASRVA